MRCTRNAVYPLGIGGSNPSLSAKIIHYFWMRIIIFGRTFLEIINAFETTFILVLSDLCL